MTDYNGSSALINKMEKLLADKKLSTAAAVRLMLEKQLHDIKEGHEIKKELIYLRKVSLGAKIDEKPKKYITLFLLIYSFSISDIREPVKNWLIDNIKMIISLF